MRFEGNLIKVSGVINFEPEHVTKKHEIQGEWKKTAMIMIGGDIAEYYAWYIKKRFHLELLKPLRGAHVTFINDRFKDIPIQMNNIKLLDELKYNTPYLHSDYFNHQRKKLWKKVIKKWEGKSVDLILDPDVRTNGKHWWFNVDENHREQIHQIRAELGLGRPHMGLHMSLGLVGVKNLELSNQIHGYIKEGLIW